MAVNDYVFKSKDSKAYLTKETKTGVISKDSREIKENEILGLLSFYFANFCKANQTNKMIISLSGKPEIEVKWIEHNEEESGPKLVTNPD